MIVPTCYRRGGGLPKGSADVSLTSVVWVRSQQALEKVTESLNIYHIFKYACVCWVHFLL